MTDAEKTTLELRGQIEKLQRALTEARWDRQLPMANETATMFASEVDELSDRKQFVRNLGWLLTQTRDGVDYCELSDDDIVTVYYLHGGKREINVAHDSYAAIVRDVARRFQ